LQIAEALGEQGARIVLSSRKAADLKQAQEHLAGLGIKSVGSPPQCQGRRHQAARDEAIAKLGKVDILVNNAGATWGASRRSSHRGLGQSDESQQSGPVSLSQRIGKLSMIPNKYGRIINSRIDCRPSWRHRRYANDCLSTSKGAVVNFTVR